MQFKDLIIIRGRNHYPQDIELTVEQSHPALQSGSGATFSVDLDGEERLVVVQELKRVHRNADVDEVVQAIRQAVAEDQELQVYAVVLIRPMSIPKTSSGKIQRYVCRAKFLEDSLDVIGSSILDDADDGGDAVRSEDSFIRKALLVVESRKERQSLLKLYLQEQVAQVLGEAASQLDPQQSLINLGIDPLMAIELQDRVEASLGVIVPAEELLAGLSVSQLVTRALDQLKATVNDSPHRAE